MSPAITTFVSSFDWDTMSVFADRTARLRPSEIREFLKLLADPGIVSFAGGIPDPALFPVSLIREAFETIMGDPFRASQALQYATSEGYMPLREWIAGYMGTLGVKCDAGNILITTGSQQAIDLAGKLFLDPTDTVLTLAPTYLGALQALDIYEPSFATISPATGEISGDILAPKLAYVVPEFANPSGETLTLAERERLLDAVTSMEIPLLEDAAYQALRYEGERLPPLLALDIARCGSIDRSRVIYAGTFSKTIAPGLRVGWVCASRSVIHKLVLARQAADLHGSSLDQMLVHAVASTSFDSHVASLLPVYRHRRDVMLAALQRFMPPEVTWTRPEGGMFVWLTLPDGADSRQLLNASLESERIIFVPGTAFYADGSGERHIRLNFTLNDDATIEDGLRRLVQTIHRCTNTRAATATDHAHAVHA
jgi:DNA-binding transcriptional MocR family regulator